MNTEHLHPMLVHFPIALVIAGFGFELAYLLFKGEICFSKAGFYLLILATVAAGFAWLSGYFLTGEMAGTAGEVKESHELSATITTVLLIAATVVRLFVQKAGNHNSPVKWFSFALYGLAAIAVSIAGFLGGSLVYEYMLPL
ncbi:MAG: DUF2231 domain-containing protein [Bacteroidales bacterium]|nr:DUF2231 domain-containing protein [Bacteroidales bacterium]